MFSEIHLILVDKMKTKVMRILLLLFCLYTRIKEALSDQGSTIKIYSKNYFHEEDMERRSMPIVKRDL